MLVLVDVLIGQDNICRLIQTFMSVGDTKLIPLMGHNTTLGPIVAVGKVGKGGEQEAQIAGDYLSQVALIVNH